MVKVDRLERARDSNIHNSTRLVEKGSGVVSKGKHFTGSAEETAAAVENLRRLIPDWSPPPAETPQE